jgi:hypothetical protein
LLAVFLVGLLADDGRGRLEAFGDNLLKRRLVPKAFDRVEHLDTGQLAVAVVIGGDAIGEMFGRHRGVAKRNAQRIDFGVMADLLQPYLSGFS